MTISGITGPTADQPTPAPVTAVKADPVQAVTTAVTAAAGEADKVFTNPAVTPILAKVKSGMPKTVRAVIHSASIVLGLAGTVAGAVAGTLTGHPSLDVAAIGTCCLAIEGAISLSHLSD